MLLTVGRLADQLVAVTAMLMFKFYDCCMQVVTETHLLQFGAMLGEVSSRAALQQREAGGPVGHPDALYGRPDTDAFYSPWEQVVCESTSSIRYWGWRRPLRNGLYMYMTRSVFLESTPSEVRQFMLDDTYRLNWDTTMFRLESVVPRRAKPQESDLLHARVHFPKPLACRAYTYARRVWQRPADGGCYCLARACEHPAGPAVEGRAVIVNDYASGCIIRTPAGHLVPTGMTSAAEVLMIYFEDSHVRAGLANLGIKKGLWPLIQKTDRALRAWQQGAVAGLQPRSVALSEADSTADESPLHSPSGSTDDTHTCHVGIITTSSSSKSSTPSTNKQGQAVGKDTQQPKPGSRWLSMASMCGYLSSSANVLVSATRWVWRVQSGLLTFVPRLEWKLMRWVMQLLTKPVTTLPNRPFGSKSNTIRSHGLPFHRVSSHPVVVTDGDMMMPRLQRIGSHPLNADDLLGNSPPSMSPLGSCSAAAWNLGPDDEGWLLGDRPVARYASAGSSFSGSYPASCSSDGSSLNRRAGPRRRKHRLIVRLMQAAGVRLAHKLLSALDQETRNGQI